MGGGRVLLVHNEIHYVPIGDSWKEVLVRNVLHYVPVLYYVPIIAPKVMSYFCRHQYCIVIVTVFLKYRF